MGLLNIVTRGDDLRFEVLEPSIVFNTAPSILKSIEHAVGHYHTANIVLDISLVEIIDSSAVGMFISVKGIAEKLQRSFVLYGADDSICRIMAFLEVDTYFLGDACCRTSRALPAAG